MIFQRYRQVISVLIVIIGFLSGVGQVYATSEPLPPIETWIQQGKERVWVREAMQFLEHTPKDAHAPQVALQLQMIARLRNDAEIRQQAGYRLLYHYPKSLATAYWLSTVRDAAQFVKIFQETLTQALRYETIDGLFLEKMLAVANMGMGRFGRGLSDKPAFFLLYSFAQLELQIQKKSMASNKDRLHLLKQKIASFKDQSWMPTVALITDRPGAKDVKALTEKIIRAHKLKKVPHGALLEQYYLMQLALLGKPLPRSVLKVVLESRLEEEDYKAALNILDLLLQEDLSAKYLFQRARVHFVLGHIKESKADLTQLQKVDAKSSWAAAGRQFEKNLQTLDQHEPLFRAAIWQMVQRLKKGFAAFEANVTILDEQKNRQQIYLAIVPSQRRLQLVISSFDAQGSKKRVVVAFRTRPGKTSFYSAKDQTLYSVAEEGRILEIRTNLDHAILDDNSFTFQMNAELKSWDQAVIANRKLFQAPLFASAEKMRPMIRKIIWRGWFPEHLETDNKGERRFIWKNIALDKPDMSRFEYGLDRKNRLTTVKLASVFEMHVRSDLKPDALQPPLWPKAKKEVTLKKEDLFGSIYFKLWEQILPMIQ
ncbi:hypothetical protein ACQZV8_03895 [Magnetococcales bacterium HHB-1]